MNTEFERKLRIAGLGGLENTVINTGSTGLIMHLENPAGPLHSPGLVAGQSTESRWRAVVRRDPHADGEFVYAVKTTGVYCRSSCPSKAAKRQNVKFFDTTGLAVATGYRACKRCQPEALSQSQKQKWNALVLQACQSIEQSDSALSLGHLAQRSEMSRYHFHRIFKTVTGLTPKSFHKAVQARRVTASLQSAPSVTEAIYDAGFNSSGRFYEDARVLLGISPSSFREGGAGEHIRYAVEPCALG